MTANRLPRLLLALIMAGIAPLLYAQNAYFQRLVWAGGEYALHYEVIIEREIDATYAPYLREFTEAPFINVLLPPGNYRYQVISYDILDKPEDVSRWANIEVRAVQREVSDTLPQPAPDMLKPLLLFAGAAWAPVFPLHGDFFGAQFSPAGIGARFGAAWSVPRGLHIGAELAAFWNINNGNLLPVGVNLLAMKWLTNQIMALVFRLGFSGIILPDTKEKIMANIGVSYLWRFTEKLLLEAGFDYAGRIKENSFDGCIRPWIGAGIIF